MADLKEFQRKMEKTLDVLASDFAAVRAGRANAQVLDRITVEYYGQPSPINQVGTVSSPDPRTLVIQPVSYTHLGMPQPVPMSIGMKDLPDRPNFRKIRSRTKAIRAM